ncbi:MAG TPA: efflux RND transporter permease subunit [Thermoanaerobaculia bacterium]|nr:efflux RND transporter permease subunit [Thermoanaerobaculia bacterium]
MSGHKSDDEIVRTTHNTARFFTENRQIAWVALVGTLLWGVFGYLSMPQRKDPDVPARVAVAICPWPGATAEKIEQLVTRRIESKMAENARVEEINSTVRTGVSIVYVQLTESTKDRGKEFDDIKLKLDTITDLPDGAGPINFIKDFGDTSALMLTVASPRTSEVEIALRSRDLRRVIEEARARAPQTPRRTTLAYCYPSSLDPNTIRRAVRLFVDWTTSRGTLHDVRFLEGPGFGAIDVVTDFSDSAIHAEIRRFLSERLHAAELHPDAWRPIIVRDPAGTTAAVRAAAGEKYTYRELDDFTDLIARTLQTVPQVSKVERSGVWKERVFLEYSQGRMAAYGVRPSRLPNLLGARNITATGGVLEAGGKNITIDPSGEFRSEKEIGDVLVTASSTGSPLYLRDLATIIRSYDTPPRFLNFFTSREKDGTWPRRRAITLGIQMRSGEQIAKFGRAVDAALAELRTRLPEDLILARTSDQPLQVKENVDLFMMSLYEAIALVVLVSLVGFWEWRSALLMAFSIPLTLAMTFGFMNMLKIDIQQVSIASLIIALGLLVDDPVVAGDAIKRSLAAGHPPKVAAWLGPTKLATAIMYATVTNIVAYLPFLLLTGDTGKFIYSLPIVIGCSLVASRLVSMTFIPLLGYYLLRPKGEPPIEERRRKGFAAWYYRVGSAAIRNRWKVFLGSLGILVLGGVMMKNMKQQFFPKDLQYLSWIDVWLPEDAPFLSTAEATQRVEDIVREEAARFGEEHGKKEDHAVPVLESMTTFVGGGGPRFWLSASPEMSQLNYAQIIVQTKDKHLTADLLERLQPVLSRSVPGARVDVRQLESGGAVGIPVSLRVSGEDIPTLRRLAGELEKILRETPHAARVRNDWGAESFTVQLKIDPDRANMVGVTNQDVAYASAGGLNGLQVATLREGDKQIPIVTRLRMDERGQLQDVQDLYVYSSTGDQKVPLGSISTLDYGMKTEKMLRRFQFRTITVSAFSDEGGLPSEVLMAAMPKIRAFEKNLPPGYRFEIAGEYKEQVKSFKNLVQVLAISVAMIFLALVLQFKSAVKPLIVFGAIPYGMVGAIAALAFMREPFGFMGFLGMVSLVGVIVSHVIVLFDFIEEKHAEGEPLEQALLDAGIIRLRPVLITVGATVIALVPLAMHGGPLWEPMCYAQIGGLTAATFITLLLVPVLYAIFVKDLKLVKWETASHSAAQEATLGR